MRRRGPASTKPGRAAGAAQDDLPRLVEDFGALTRDFLRIANQGLGHLAFLRGVTARIVEFSRCAALELRLERGRSWVRWTASGAAPAEGRFEEFMTSGTAGALSRLARDASSYEALCSDLALGLVDRATPGLTKNGGLAVAFAEAPLRVRRRLGPDLCELDVTFEGPWRSLALLPFAVDGENVGLLVLQHREPAFFSPRAVEFYQGLAQPLGVAVSDHRVRYQLRERVKELTCLYGIARVVERPGLALGEVLQRFVELLPPAWQYPEAASACLELDGRSYTAGGYRAEFDHCLSAEIAVGGVRRGRITVCYGGLDPVAGRDPFLSEENSLIEAVAREVALIVERRHAQEERERLEGQLRHADRLANIGLLAAGVAHELNEPLGNVLGFAQLAAKAEGLPGQAREDLDRIVAASLYAREVVKKLMLFARQLPPKEVEVDLNQVIADALYLFESRCAKAGIELVRRPAPDLPRITGDPSQLTQVLVNLVVNAIQAMPGGGRLTVGTGHDAGGAVLFVEDTGVGIPPDVQPQIFLPFFTTKDVSEGTGLGLPVVHGIVTAHGGTIAVRSEPGAGSRFEVALPVRRERPA